MKNILAFRLIFTAFFASLLLFGSVAFFNDYASAQSNTTPRNGRINNTNSNTTNPSNSAGSDGLVPCGRTADRPCTLADAFRIFIVVTNYLIGMAGIVAVISIVWSGCSMVTAAGNTEALTSAKKRLSNSILGFFLVMAALVLINSFLFKGQGIINTTVDILINPLEYIQNP